MHSIKRANFILYFRNLYSPFVRSVNRKVAKPFPAPMNTLFTEVLVYFSLLSFSGERNENGKPMDGDLLEKPSSCAVRRGCVRVCVLEKE